jgi:hypothetical protein
MSLTSARNNASFPPLSNGTAGDACAFTLTAIVAVWPGTCYSVFRPVVAFDGHKLLGAPGRRFTTTLRE